MTVSKKLNMALVIDPRFPGGTSSAVAREIRALNGKVDLRIYGLETRIFKGQKPSPQLEDVCEELGLTIEWNPKVIRAEVVAFHNPSCLKFDTSLKTRIICDQLFVIAHENFLRPNGSEGYDVAKTMQIIEDASLARVRHLAPISAYNRRGVETWLATSGRPWTITDFHWFNICDFELQAPVANPRDRRGRLSRAGFEKFPAMPVMQKHFPAHAESCEILGADSFLLDRANVPSHWRLYPFGSQCPKAFLHKIDFFVYFTHPQLRESFGRVIAEAIAAGKVVITDPGTAENFGAAVVASTGDNVDMIIAGFVQDAARYTAFVEAAQASLAAFGSDAFTRQLLSAIQTIKDTTHALL